MKLKITEKDFIKLTSKIKGMPVSHIWQGYGSAIFLEFGKLHKTEYKNFRRGEFTLMLDWEWRIERKRSIFLGSGSTEKRITNQLLKLKNLKVFEIGNKGRLPEIIINLENKYWIHSFSTIEGQPQWVLFITDSSWICIENGLLYQENDKN